MSCEVLFLGFQQCGLIFLIAASVSKSVGTFCVCLRMSCTESIYVKAKQVCMMTERCRLLEHTITAQTVALVDGNLVA